MSTRCWSAGIQPNLIVGMLLGAEFMPTPHADADISAPVWPDGTLRNCPSPQAAGASVDQAVGRSVACRCPAPVRQVGGPFRRSSGMHPAVRPCTGP